MNQLAWIAPSLLSLVALGGNYVQQRKISELETRLAAVTAASEKSGAADESALIARIERLERQSSWRSAAAAAPAAPSAPAPAGAAPTGDVQQLREDVDALLTGEATATEQGKARLRALIAETQQAQLAERQERRDERILARLTEAAHLSSRQHDDLNKAMADERTQRRALLANGRGNPDEIRPAMQALRAQTDQRARQILDAEQYKQYEASRTFGRGNRGGGGNNNGGGGPAAVGGAE